jgi:Lar family restriction alleviation protein
MSEELKSCPFCGGTAALAEEGDRTRQYLVFCNSCGISTDADTRRERPVSDWNTRRPEPPRREAEQMAVAEAMNLAHDAIDGFHRRFRDEMTTEMSDVLLYYLNEWTDKYALTPAKGKEK